MEKKKKLDQVEEENNEWDLDARGLALVLWNLMKKY